MRYGFSAFERNMKKNLFARFVGVGLAAALILGAAACGSGSSQATTAEAPTTTAAESTEAAEKTDAAAENEGTESEAAETEATESEAAKPGTDAVPAPEDASDNKIVVGVNPVPHANILEDSVKAVLADAGWDLEVVIFQDYVLPNTSLEEGELDANYFQTLGYMNVQNEESGLHLAAVAGVHIEPMGIYSQRYASISELPDGAEIGVPNDPDNCARGLSLLVQKGLLVSLGDYGTNPDVTAESLTNNAEANPHGYKITPLEAASLPLSLPDLAAAVINGNYALGANLPATYPALEIEEFDDDTTVRRTNFVVVKHGNEDALKTKALVAAIQSDAVKTYIEETYKGAVIPSFIDPQ